MSNTDWYGAHDYPWALPLSPWAGAPAAPSSPAPATHPLLPSGQPWGDAPIIFPHAKTDPLPLPASANPWWLAPPIFPSAADLAAPSAPPPAMQLPLPSGQPWGHAPIIFARAKLDQLPLPQPGSPSWLATPIFPSDPVAMPTAEQPGPARPSSSTGQPPTVSSAQGQSDLNEMEEPVRNRLSNSTSGDAALSDPTPPASDLGPPLIGDGGQFSPGLPSVNRLADRASTSIGKAISNIPSSAYEFGRNLAQPVIHPIDTLDGFKNLGLGLLEKAGIKTSAEHIKYADALGRYFLDRYGSLENLQQTFEQDPVGLASDLLSVFNGGAALAARGAGMLGRVGKVADAVERAELRASGAVASTEAAKASTVAQQAAGAEREIASASSPSKIAHDVASAGVTPNGKHYSVAYQTQLNPKSYKGVSRPRHYQEANEALLRAIESDPEFAQSMADIGVTIRRTPRGLAPRRPPPGWTWHHATEPGVMQLVPRAQHSSGSAFWRTLHPHPGAAGGFSLWNR